MSQTEQGQLKAVNQAITAILSGGAVQKYQIGGRSIEKYSLTELYDIKERLMRSISGKKGLAINKVSFNKRSYC